MYPSEYSRTTYTMVKNYEKSPPPEFNTNDVVFTLVIGKARKAYHPTDIMKKISLLRLT